MSKYDPLSRHFRDLGGQAWHATFEDIERILGFPLPNSARAHPAWWANSADKMPQMSAWLNAGLDLPRFRGQLSVCDQPI